MTRRTVLSAWLLAGLLMAVFIAVLVTPSMESGRPSSSYSAGSDGVRLSRDLIARLGWSPEARLVPFSDSVPDPAPIQVLVDVPVSDRETHDLLAFARRGGSLLVAGGGGAIYDSLGLVARAHGKFEEVPFAPNCESRGTLQTVLAAATYASAIGSSRPLPPDTVGFGSVVSDDEKGPVRKARAAVGLPIGSGRIVVIADGSFLSNDVIRRCELETDAEFVRMIEYLSRGQRGLRVAFDEFHHGYGVRGGSLTAIRMYLSGLPSGRMLAQIAIGGLLLLFAAAPRPLAPRDPTHVARRSPLEHADALAQAYASVGATRTATARLLAGVRRRSRRSRARDTDDTFLASAASMSPKAAKASELVSSALERTVPDRQLPEVAAALQAIERDFSRPPSSPR